MSQISSLIYYDLERRPIIILHMNGGQGDEQEEVMLTRNKGRFDVCMFD
jgi:hypothetical protein